MSKSSVYEKIAEALKVIRDKTSVQPQIGLILGSGLGSVADEVSNALSLSFSSIPHFQGTAVEGHLGKMILGEINNISTVILQGRFHAYEGYSMEDVVFPTRVIAALGIHTLILTNAAGAINTRYRPGDLMVIEDHLNLTGDNPLKGPNLQKLGPRFPDLSDAYSQSGRQIITETLELLKIPAHSGVYAGLLGPNYETPAEIRMLRVLGADAVGMSTVTECIAANHLGIRVLGVSCITNLAAGLSSHKLSHQEVIENSKLGAEKMKRMLVSLIPRLSSYRKASE